MYEALKAAGKFRVYSPNENKKEENDDDDDDNLFDNDKKNRNIKEKKTSKIVTGKKRKRIYESDDSDKENLNIQNNNTRSDSDEDSDNVLLALNTTETDDVSVDEDDSNSKKQSVDITEIEDQEHIEDQASDNNISNITELNDRIAINEILEENALAIAAFVDITIKDNIIIQDLTARLERFINTLRNASCSYRLTFKDLLRSAIKKEVEKYADIKSTLDFIRDSSPNPNINNLRKYNESCYNEFRIKYAERYANSIENYKQEDQSNLNEGQSNNRVVIRRNNDIIYDSKKKQKFCLIKHEDVLAIIYLLNHTYVQKYVRSCDCLIKDILTKLLKSLNIDDIVIIDNKEKNNDDQEPIDPSNAVTVGMETTIGMVGGTQSDEPGLIDENERELDYILGNSSNSNPTLSFSDEVQEEIIHYDELIAKHSTDTFTDGTCNLNEQRRFVKYSAKLDFTENLSYNAMRPNEKKIMDDYRDDDDHSIRGENLWTSYLNEKYEANNKSFLIQCEIEYHLCNMHELFVRFYNMQKEPTCIFMIIGMSLYLFTLGLTD
jgi:hypothetical protein